MREHPMNERAPGGETRGFLATVDVLHGAMSPRCSDDPCVCTPQERRRLADAANDVCNALAALTPGEGYCDQHDEIGCKACSQGDDPDVVALLEANGALGEAVVGIGLTAGLPAGTSATAICAEVALMATYRESAIALARRFDEVFETFGLPLDTPWPTVLATIRRQHQMLQLRQDEQLCALEASVESQEDPRPLGPAVHVHREASDG